MKPRYIQFIDFAQDEPPYLWFTPNGGLTDLRFSSSEHWRAELPARVGKWVSLEVEDEGQDIHSVHVRVRSYWGKVLRQGHFSLLCGQEKIMVKVVQYPEIVPALDPTFHSFLCQKCGVKPFRGLPFTKLAAITELTVDQSALIFDSLSGIEYLPNLERLTLRDVYGFSTLDLSFNRKLTHFECVMDGVKDDAGYSLIDEKFRRYADQMKLSQLDFGENRVLEDVRCLHSYVTSMDLTHLTSLKRLECSGYIAKKLDLSRFPLLEHLKVQKGNLSILDLSSNPMLKTLDCSHTGLRLLNVSQCTQLKSLDCSHNRLTELDVLDNLELDNLEFCDNPLRRVYAPEQLQWTCPSLQHTPLKTTRESVEACPMGDHAAESAHSDECDS